MLTEVELQQLESHIQNKGSDNFAVDIKSLINEIRLIKLQFDIATYALLLATDGDSQLLRKLVNQGETVVKMDKGLI